MTKIILYTKDYCSYCNQTKDFLIRKDIEFTEFDVQADPALVDEMIERSGGRRTVPQIFIGDKHLGGASDFFELHEKGELDALLLPFQKAA